MSIVVVVGVLYIHLTLGIDVAAFAWILWQMSSKC